VTDGSKPEPAPPKTDDPHVDIGTTILHAYRNLTPEQIGGMRRDTKELMELQKELMGSLSEMKPAIEQGAELSRHSVISSERMSDEDAVFHRHTQIHDTWDHSLK
jgi:hypothetical protein